MSSPESMRDARIMFALANARDLWGPLRHEAKAFIGIDRNEPTIGPNDAERRPLPTDSARCAGCGSPLVRNGLLGAWRCPSLVQPCCA